MNRERLVLSINGLRHFIDGSLGLDDSFSVSGFELSEHLLDAAAFNTYVETMGNKADTLYLRVKESLTEMTTYSYLAYLKRLSDKFGWREKELMVAFDFTDEDFYGDVQGFSIHGWTGENGITGKFKFLTCSIVSDEIPEKIPLISIPANIGDYKSYAILYCLNLIKPYVGKINLILFDRGFYDKDLMYELSKQNFSYLIFVPKSHDKKEILYPLIKGEHIVIIHDFIVNKDKSKYSGETFLTFLKEIYDPKSEKEYDWVLQQTLRKLHFQTSYKLTKKGGGSKQDTVYKTKQQSNAKVKK